jgi:hypothetical protein
VRAVLPFLFGITAGFIVAVAFVVTVSQDDAPPPIESCVIGGMSVVLPAPGGGAMLTYWMGEQLMCFTDLRQSAIYGPSLDSYRTSVSEEMRPVAPDAIMPPPPPLGPIERMSPEIMSTPVTMD